jgi:hypothetical protein
MSSAVSMPLRIQAPVRGVTREEDAAFAGRKGELRVIGLSKQARFIDGQAVKASPTQRRKNGTVERVLVVIELEH